MLTSQRTHKMKGAIMSASKSFICAIIILVMVFFVTDTQAKPHKVNWDAFSINLVIALKSNHPGLQESAMQRIIRYSDSLNVDDAVYDIALIFRFDDNPQLRRLAMVTLSKINTDHSLGYLCQFMKYEDNPAIKKQCCRVITNYYASQKPDKMDELAVLLREANP
jgi:hypothetical protein